MSDVGPAAWERRRTGEWVVLSALLVLGLAGRSHTLSPAQGPLVEVTGDVPYPGLYRVEEATVAEAIQKAGGPQVSDERLVTEGQRVHWSVDGAELAPSTVPLLMGRRLDVNVATEEVLTVLDGIGPATARAIVSDRERRGLFYAIGDLTRVSGVGPTTLTTVASLVTVGEVGPRPPPSRIDLNSASLTQLDRLPEIGPVTAERIVAARAQQPFESVQDLQRVHGIGPKTIARIRDRVRVSDHAGGGDGG